MFSTCFSTVGREMISLSAIWRSDTPYATRRNTSTRAPLNGSGKPEFAEVVDADGICRGFSTS
jgi:hypothetical protein